MHILLADSFKESIHKQVAEALKDFKRLYQMQLCHSFPVGMEAEGTMET